VEAVRCGPDPVIEATLNDIMASHVAAHYAQDAVAAAGDYAEDVWFIGDDGMDLRTRDVMVSLYEQMYQGIRLVDFTHSPEEVVVCADAAHSVGHYTETAETDGQQSTTRYNYMLLWRLQPDGSWKIWRGTFVAVPPSA
jgi:uncharacterized protein (TIGR02246 family)